MSATEQQPWRVREPWPDEASRLLRHFQTEARCVRARRLGAWVIEASDPERLVGLANWGEVKALHGTEVPPRRVLWMEVEVRPAWLRHAATDSLIRATIAQARDSGGDELMTRVAADGPLFASAQRMGFVEQSRQEALSVSVALALEQLEDIGTRVIEREPVVVSPVMQADLARVKALCSQTGLLPAERVHPLTPGMPGGFDPNLSFFVGETNEPVAVLLGREQAGVAYLEVLASDPAVRRASASGVVALMRAFFRAARALELGEVTCVVRPGSNPGLMALIRRTGSTSKEAVAELHLHLSSR